MLWEQNRVTGYRHGSGVSKGGQENLTPGADPNVDTLLEGVGDNENWDFDGAIGEKSAQRIGTKRQLLSLQNECRTKRRRIPTNDAGVVGLAEDLLCSADGSVRTAPSSNIYLSLERMLQS